MTSHRAGHKDASMEHRPFGPTGRAVSVIGQGTWNLEQADRAGAIAALRCGLDLGMTHIDTAEMYGSGAAEALVGEAIAGRRDEVFLVSKVLPQNASRDGTIAACERSLARLRTDRLDCYLLHWRGGCRSGIPSPRSRNCRRRAKSAPGASAILTWPTSEEARGIAGDGRIACNQVLYHLEERAIEHAVIPWCEAHGVAVTAYSPFGHHRFVDPRTPGGEVLAEIAGTHDATPRQVALAFLTRRPSVFAIPKASAASTWRKRRGGRAASVAGRGRPHRRGVPARPPAPLAADAIVVIGKSSAASTVRRNG